MNKNQIAIDTYNHIAQKYTDAYYSDTADLPYIQKFLSMLPAKAKILDAGCGPGTFMQHILKQEYAVEGIDLSKTMIHIAKTKLPQATFKLMDIRTLDYADDTFDAILTAYSLIHIPTAELASTLHGFKRVLKPNGLLMIIAQKGEADRLIDEPFMPSKKMFFNFFTKERLKKLLTNQGFTIEFEEEVSFKDPDGLTDAAIYCIVKKTV